MEPEIARGIAHYSHHGRRDGRGELRIEHVVRVVAAVPPSARTTAWLHDVLEHSDTRPATLRDEGMTMGFRHVESGPLVRSSYHAERHVGLG